MAENRERLACDYAVISDTSQFARDQPAITYGLKGLAYFEVIVRGAKSDLHSGTFGGAVANPCNALAVILASLKGPDGRIQIPGFYDSVRPLEDWERAEFARLPFSEAEFQASVSLHPHWNFWTQFTGLPEPIIIAFFRDEDDKTGGNRLLENCRQRSVVALVIRI